MTLAGKVLLAAGADAVSVATAAAATTGVDASVGDAITVADDGVCAAAIPSLEIDLSRFLSSLLRLDSELLLETVPVVFVLAPMADGGAAAVGVVVALFTRLPLLPETDGLLFAGVAVAVDVDVEVGMGTAVVLVLWPMLSLELDWDTATGEAALAAVGGDVGECTDEAAAAVFLLKIGGFVPTEAGVAEVTAAG